MTTQARSDVAVPSRKHAYVAPQVRLYGTLRELTLDQKTNPMPADNSGGGQGGKT